MFFALIGIVIGLVIGLVLPFTYNAAYSLYISVAILACLDSVFGGIKANLEKKFDSSIFISGFFGNAILAAFLAYIGDRLGVPLYYAAIFTFGGRLFENFASIRRILLNKRKSETKVEE
ncbi:small basic protein [Keratinibaculum paraultunense]|uniref:Small basic protein n=1 Tax=Keratinibaculum paraultunense TaxID=1278232 RepID=A0A4R3KYZ8_9FIRM|nr:small basic family protein [Keratinibaculum paraultunense]QQY80543.1 small basic family protein [Keratinibaculum paraultunense]TCS91266.1 small basic protein [Keratinibaculum paraultunense]